MVNEINPINPINLIMARFDNEPALVREGQGAWFQSCCHAVASMAEEVSKIEMAADDFWFSSDDYRSQYRPYKVQDGIPTIPVKGLLLEQLLDHLRQLCDRLRLHLAGREARHGRSAGQGHRVLGRQRRRHGQRQLRPRGSHLCAARQEADARDHLDGAYSAAYSIASVTDRIVMGRTAEVGSIGVVTTHMEYSEAFKQWGIKGQHHPFQGTEI